MALDNEIDEVEETEEFENDEPRSERPDSGSFSRESLTEQAFAEGAEESVIEELGNVEAHPEITIDDLRQIPGTEKLTDAQLMAQWEKAQAEAGGESAAEKPLELPFPVYDAQGNKIAADKLTLSDLFSGKVQIGYQAMGKEQRKAFSELVRNASQGHFNEHRYNTVQGQYRETAQKLAEREKAIATYEAERTQWNAALTALVMGNNGPMKALVEAYKGGLTKTGITPDGFVPKEQVEQQRQAEEAGYKWWTDVGVPAAYDIATRYGADAKEVQNAIQYYINNEPNLTQARIDEIIKFDVPYALEQNGYSSNGQPAQAGTRTGGQPNQSNEDVSELRKQVQALQAKLAENANASVARTRTKVRNAPAAGSGATAGAGDSMPSFKDRASMKEWLQSS